MDGFDFSPLFRSTIGFDRLMRLADAATPGRCAAPSYPPYNIEVDRRERLSPDHGGGRLLRRGPRHHRQGERAPRHRQGAREDEAQKYLHRGIARRAFERRFQLADHIRVDGREPRERPAACRSRARGSRGDEAPQDRDRRRRQRPAADRAKGGLNPGPATDGSAAPSGAADSFWSRQAGGAAPEGRPLEGARFEGARSGR